MYVLKAEVWPYELFPAGHMGTKVRLPLVYNSPPWGIRQLTISELATLWNVPLLLQEKLEEFDKKYLLVQKHLSVPGDKFLLASNYLISSRLRGGW